MARISEQFSNQFINTETVASLEDKCTPLLVIRSVDDEDVGNVSKLVISFKGTDKRMPLNKTNGQEIAELLGEDDTDDWKGAAIKLGVGKTMFQGKRVPCLVVLEAHEKGSEAATAAAASKEKLPF